MPQHTVPLGVGIDLIIDEPYNVEPSNRAAIIASAVINEFNDGSASVSPWNGAGAFDFKIGGSIFKIYYQYKTNRVINALEAYSGAIRYIESNPHLFDQRLSRKAIEVLKKCFNDELR